MRRPILFADLPCDWSVRRIEVNRDVLVSVWQPGADRQKVTASLHDVMRTRDVFTSTLQPDVNRQKLIGQCVI